MTLVILPWVPMLVAALATWLLLALLLRRADALPVDLPNERSLHQRPVPRIGGLAVFPAIVMTCVVVSADDAVAYLSLATVLFVISIADDWRNLPVGLRLGAHVAMAAGFAWSIAGVSLIALAGVFAMVWMTNLYNFMDGANGLAGGMTVIGFGALALAGSEPSLAAAVVGAGLGFLRYNFDPARVFLGDAGSIPLGFLAAAICFEGVVQERWPLWFPVLVFAPFVVDATVTLLRRMARGEKFWAAHRQHYYQRLVQLGWTHRRLALAEYMLMAAVAASALALLSAPPFGQWLGVAAWGLVYALLMRWIDRLWQRKHAG